MTYAESKAGSNRVYFGIEWNENNSSATQFTIAPVVYRWDAQSTNNYGSSFKHTLSPDPSGAGSWSGISYPSGSGYRQLDYFNTRTYAKTHSVQTITWTAITDASFGTYYNGWVSIGSLSRSFTMTIPAKTSYTVSFNANGGSGAPSSQTKWHGESLTLSTTKPTRTGYTFNGWNTKSDGTGTNYAAGASYTGNAALTLYAKWTINTYSVQYANGGHGTAPAAQTKTYGTALTLRPSMGTVSNYKFKDWKATNGTTYNGGGSYTANAATTMTAEWYAPYTVSYNANGGSGAPSSQVKVYGNSVNISSTVPTRTNYNFIEWNTNASGTGTKYTAGQAYSTNANLTLYAIWEIAHSNPTISNLLVQRCLQDGTLADDGEYCKVSATVSVDNSTEGYTDTKLKTVTVQVGSNAAESVTVDTTATSASISFVSVNQVSLTSMYAVKLTVTDSHDFSSFKTSNLSVAYFTMHFKEGGHGIAIGKKSVTDNLFDVNMDLAIQSSNLDINVTPSESTYNSRHLALTGQSGAEIGKVDIGRLANGASEMRFVTYLADGAATAGDRWGLVRLGRDPADEYGYGYFVFDKTRPIINFGTTEASVDFATTNPQLEFRNSNASQRGKLVFTDYDAVHSGATLAWVTNQPQSWFHTQYISAEHIQPPKITSGISYITGNQGTAALYLSKNTGSIWYPAICLDTTSGGSWAIGNYNNENLQFSWASKENRDSSTNSTRVVNLPNNPGTIPVPVQLYNNTSGSNGNITLSDTAANYNYLRIFFYGKSTASGSATKYECVEVYAPNGKIAQLSCTGQGSSGATQVIFFSKMVTISAKAVSSTSYCSASIDSNGTTCAKNNEVYITRVEGWK